MVVSAVNILSKFFIYYYFNTRKELMLYIGLILAFPLLFCLVSKQLIAELIMSQHKKPSINLNGSYQVRTHTPTTCRPNFGSKPLYAL